MFGWRAGRPKGFERPKPVAEPTTVVMRRQIPVRFGEPPRSWLGGHPMMPEHIPWPRSTLPPTYKDNTSGPLHFVAQIACADLPADLWGGLGPRTGWLLLFLDGRDAGTDEHPSLCQVLYIDRLGPERRPPADARPMRDETYTGYQHDHQRSEADIPPFWRRWPVDLVSFPNTLEPDLPGQPMGDQIGVGPPRMTPEALYGDAPIDRRRGRSEESPWPPEEDRWPFTWRGALHVVDSVIRVLRNPRGRVKLTDADRALFRDPAWGPTQIDRLKAALAEIEAKSAAAATGFADDPARRKRALDHWAERRTTLAEGLHILETHPGLDGQARLEAEVDRSIALRNAWAASALADTERMRAAIPMDRLDMAVPQGGFRPVFDWLRREGNARLALLRPGGYDGRFVGTIRQTLLDYAKAGFRAGRSEAATDLYVKSAEARDLIPADLRARLEAQWRNVERPHRMGGWHDGIQSEATGKAPNDLLLFQIASDDALQWCWGDVGAHYIWIKAADLAAGRFDRIEARFENY